MLAAEKPDARRVEWLVYSDRAEARAVPLPRSLANLERWEGGRVSQEKHKLPAKQRPDGTVGIAPRGLPLGFTN